MKHISYILNKRFPHYLGEDRHIFATVTQKNTRMQQTTSAKEEKVYRIKTFINVASMTANDFLRLSPEERTESVTKPRMVYGAVHAGSMLRIDFSGNEELEHGVALRDIVPHWVQEVRVTDTMGNKKNGHRKGDIFVSANEKRMVIHTGFLVEVVR